MDEVQHILSSPDLVLQRGAAFNSGSSVMTYFKANGRDEAYAFTGPLSMHKGCDKASFLKVQQMSLFLRDIDEN